SCAPCRRSSRSVRSATATRRASQPPFPPGPQARPPPGETPNPPLPGERGIASPSAASYICDRAPRRRCGTVLSCVGWDCVVSWRDAGRLFARPHPSRCRLRRRSVVRRAKVCRSDRGPAGAKERTMGAWVALTLLVIAGLALLLRGDTG